MTSVTEGTRPSSDGRQAGFVAGAEALVLGVLVFVLGTLVVLNGWAVLDARFAASAAAREAVRAVVEAPPGTDPEQLQTLAAVVAGQAFAAHGFAEDAVAIVPEVPLGQARCARVRFRAEVVVVLTILPRLSDWSRTVVRAVHEEVVDPFRSGFEGEVRCGF